MPPSRGGVSLYCTAALTPYYFFGYGRLAALGNPVQFMLCQPQPQAQRSPAVPIKLISDDH